MIEEIGKVKLNLNYYSGQDLYSDGDIENELLEIVKNNQDYNEILENDSRWPILYHLSKDRGNIIEWYPFDKNSKVLEIGAGCGAITSTLAKLTGHVTCVELSKRRSLINSYRNQDCDNVEIIVGDFNQIEFEHKFDYITLIGVLEYAPSFSESNKPFHELLTYVKSLLKPNGKLFIAIENRFGLKYWAGAREDHTGKFFDSLEGYYDSNRVRTFSKNELLNILKDVGLEKSKFYYPIPDYKLPYQIFSDTRLPQIGELRNLIHNFDQDRVQLFNEEKIFDTLIENEKFGFFANSFLVISE
ncbi:methyltransferase type 12 [Lysinibacillus contaminans]|uniref:Methyltransferase type 12 n=1 Tax=Lysinibacillus contaminans TaxID=1293441 RepID=A0ABR5JX76_9BACI|nr:class I SAM-dependent methyltransferase [Lysinibacillus contaminans]KOS66605.1 methyltransferase type 12 [Lysinibacillus contaminans]